MHRRAEFSAYSRLADELIDKATKDQLADAARLLALNIGYYHEKYGDVPQETLLRHGPGANTGRRDLTPAAAWYAKPCVGGLLK